MTLLAFCVSITIFGNVLSTTVEKAIITDKPKPLRGPRDDLNETGRLLFPHRHTGEYLLCKNCSRRALYNGQYRNEQEVVCINKNYDKMEPYADLTFKIYPYCKIGTDLVCGKPPFNSSNSYWICYPGYSLANYSVYSTCQLICNSSNTVIGQIYCSEKLLWHVDQYPTEECLEPVLPNRGSPASPRSTGTTEWTVIIPVVCGTVVAVIGVGVLIWFCYKRKKRLSRPPSADIVENGSRTNPEAIPLTNQHPRSETDGGNSIGDCSIDVSEGESSRLLNGPLTVNMSTSTSMLDTCGQNNDQLPDGQDVAGHHAGQLGLGVSNRSTSSQTDDGQQVSQARLGASCSSNNDNEQSGQESGHQNGQSGLGSSGRSASTHAESDHPDQEDGILNEQIESGDTSIEAFDEQNGHENECEIGLPRLGSSSKSGSSRTDSERSGQENENQCPIQNREEISQSDCEQENVLRSSGRLDSSQNNNEPYLKIFTAETDSKSRCESGGNRLQENAFSVQIGSSIYFIPSQANVITVKIIRKGEGPPFRGVQCIGPNTYAIEKVTLSDDGLYVYIITWEQDGETRTKEGSFELFVRNEDSTFNNRDAGEPSGSLQAENQQSQKYTVEEHTQIHERNGAERSHNGQGQSLGNATTSGRLPPEGAENEAPQASGQGHPKFNGARPKIKQTISPTVVSGASLDGVKDPQPMKHTVPNNLDLSKIAGDEKLIIDNLNISEDLPSVEDNNGLIEPQSEDLSNKDAQGMLSSEHLNFSSLLGSIENPSVSQQNDINDSEAQSNSDNVSDKSVELTSVELEKLKPNETNLDFSEILDSDAIHNLGSNSSNIQTSVNNGPQTLVGPRSLSHLDPATLNQEFVHLSCLDSSGVDISRPDPSGRSEEPQVIEHSRHETEPKELYRRNEGVRGEQTAEDSSVFNQPEAHVRLTSTDRINSGQKHEGRDTISVDRIQPAVVHIGEARRELSGSVQGAEGGAPIVNGTHQQNRADNHGSHQCITLLRDLNDTDCLQDVCWHANPREKNPDAKTWFGLCSFYGYPRHQLEAIAFAKKSDPNNGPMYYALTVLLAQQNLRVGDVVYYYTLESSYRPDIVEHFVYKCKNHINCKYCQELSRRARLRYQVH